MFKIYKNKITKNLSTSFRNFLIELNNNNCKYCKNRIVTMDKDKLFSDRCIKFIISDNRHLNNSYELAYDARKDENKCGINGKYYENKYFRN